MKDRFCIVEEIGARGMRWRLQECHFFGFSSCLRSTANVQFAVNIPKVGFDGTHRYKKFFSDGFVRKACGNES